MDFLRHPLRAFNKASSNKKSLEASKKLKQYKDISRDFSWKQIFTAQKMKLFIKDFFSKCDCEFGHIYWKKSFMGNLFFVFCAVYFCQKVKLWSTSSKGSSSVRSSWGVSLRPASLFKKRLWHKCFPVNFAKILRTPSLQNTSRRLLL